VNNSPPVSNLPSSYDDFLFASVGEEENGMQLSVLSALARRDVDPWDEASRLAAMSKANAASTLISILDPASKKYLNPSDAQAMAARLVRLLPQGENSVADASTDTARAAALPKTHWLVWLGFGIAISLMSPHHQAPMAKTDGSTTKSDATSQVDSVRAGDTSPAPQE
jgi:hypothetical protein